MTTAAPDLEALSAEDVLAEAVERFHPRLALACSFQKEESVLLHMLLRLRPHARGGGEARLGRGPRPVEDEPARRLERARRVELHRRAPAPLPPPPRPWL